MESANYWSSGEESNSHKTEGSQTSKRETSWPFVLFYIHLNILGLYGIFVMFTSCSYQTILFTFILGLLGILGVTAGAHRLWSHQAYRANVPLRICLMLCQTMAGQGSIYNWVQAHRLHHKMFRQAEDPFHSGRDFLSAHVRAQLTSYTPEQESLLGQVDMSDLEQEKILMFQKKFYWILYFILNVLLPINAPLEYWGESLAAAVFVTFSLRYVIVLNVCWLINSAHFIWGLDRNFKPSDSNMVFFISKSYWPHYHYLLPSDYQSGEFGNYGQGLITAFLRVFAILEMATGLQTITSTAVKDGLTIAVESGRPVSECIEQKAFKKLGIFLEHHFLNRDKFM